MVILQPKHPKQFKILYVSVLANSSHYYKAYTYRVLNGTEDDRKVVKGGMKL